MLTPVLGTSHNMGELIDGERTVEVKKEREFYLCLNKR
jgi:hypothetical protein